MDTTQNLDRNTLDTDTEMAAVALGDMFQNWEFERIRSGWHLPVPDIWKGHLFHAGSTLLFTPEEADTFAASVQQLIVLTPGASPALHDVPRRPHPYALSWPQLWPAITGTRPPSREGPALHLRVPHVHRRLEQRKSRRQRPVPDPVHLGQGHLGLLWRGRHSLPGPGAAQRVPPVDRCARRQIAAAPAADCGQRGCRSRSIGRDRPVQLSALQNDREGTGQGASLAA